ncbi:MAG: SatD family protein [Flavobacterium sp.]|uniref:SatD family protein n=1 Tax=Flavobacterium sp. TaxID=239 RepID=UPI0022CB0541|nr:SatD family protein [Flavobacterium sp.]MCZ8090178.1 SatD family protein [Flavobacterium sp.]MCZ8329920.1 SatD family protein [Flavobacterium sp.]
MIVILTADIINSRKLSSKKWMNDFKQLLNSFGKSPNDWEIYRGDEFQLEIKNPEDAFLIAFQLKAFFKSINLDVRMSLGFGDKTYKTKKITESNGSAFIRSGELFETLKKQKINLAVNSGNPDFDEEFNLILQLSMSFMDSWLQQSAEFVLVAIQNPTLSQEEIGLKLGINQAAVSRRQKRSQYELLLQVERYFRKKVKSLEV